MQLSLYADYSCRTLMYLALRTDDQRSSIEEIANAYHISVNHLVKVVHNLGKLGYIETTRGRNGGIVLAQKPEDIKIGDVIRRTEPSFNLVECFTSTTNSCPITSACGLKPWLQEAMEAFLSTLDKVTLADIIAKRRALAKTLGV